MKASSNNLLSIIKGPRQFVIPIYQRTYSWQLVQCNQLLNDILRITKSIVQRDFDISAFLVAALFYLIFTFILTNIFNYLERRFAVYED